MIVVLGLVGGGDDRGGGDVVGYGLVFIRVKAARIGPDKAFIKDAARKLVEMFFFQGAQHAGANFCGDGNILKSNALLLPLLFKLRTE